MIPNESSAEERVEGYLLAAGAAVAAHYVHLILPSAAQPLLEVRPRLQGEGCKKTVSPICRWPLPRRHPRRAGSSGTSCCTGKGKSLRLDKGQRLLANWCPLSISTLIFGKERGSDKCCCEGHSHGMHVRSQAHQKVTGIFLPPPQLGCVHCTLCSRVFCRHLQDRSNNVSPCDANEFIAGGQPMDKSDRTAPRCRALHDEVKQLQGCVCKASQESRGVCSPVAGHSELAVIDAATLQHDMTLNIN